MVERGLERIKRRCRIATRYDTTLSSFRSFLALALVYLLTLDAAGILPGVYVVRPLTVPSGTMEVRCLLQSANRVNRHQGLT